MKAIKDPIIDQFCDLYHKLKDRNDDVVFDLYLTTVGYIHSTYPELSDTRLENLLRKKGLPVPERAF